jgi:hypothetical protein
MRTDAGCYAAAGVWTTGSIRITALNHKFQQFESGISISAGRIGEFLKMSITVP